MAAAIAAPSAASCHSIPAGLRRLNPAALEFVSSRSGSEAGSPDRCSSPVSSQEAQGGSPREMPLKEQQIDTAEREQQSDADSSERRGSGGGSSRTAGGSSSVGDVIPAPAHMPRLARRSSSSSLNSGTASPPPPVMPHPGLMPTYGWAPVYAPHHAMYHPAPAVPPPHDGPVDRAASPPAVFPTGGSPPLPTGFISVPLHAHHHAALSHPGSPTSSHMYGTSPPHHPSPFGTSPPPYGSSPPPGMAGSPPGLLYLPPPPMLHHAHSGEYTMAHPGYVMQQQPHQQQDYVQRMANMSLAQAQGAPPPASQQQQQQRGGPGSSGGSARSEGRASARIARSHRAGGAYNPAEFEFDVEEAESGRVDARRTVMIRNIPNKYTQEMMLSVLHKSGFSGQFDFFYLPIDFRNKCNLGYAFVNFLEAPAAGRLYREYHQKRWEEYNSKKVCEVTYGRVQGRDALVTHFRTSKFPSDDAEFMPLVYTRVDRGVASHPLPIHQYLAVAGSSGSDSAGAGSNAAQQAGSEAGEEAEAVGDVPAEGRAPGSSEQGSEA